jgi:predicted nucleic acid-binding protein
MLPVDLETARLWGEITARGRKGGKTLAALDGLIAATALRHGLHLMTRNERDFADTGVLIVNPWQE